MTLSPWLAVLVAALALLTPAGAAVAAPAGAAVAAPAGAAVAAPARAAVVEGSANGVFDSSAIDENILHVQVVYDDTGKITAVVTFRSPPLASDNAEVSVLFGTAVSGTRCASPAAGIAGPTAGGGTVSWARFDAAGRPTAKGQDGTDTSRGDTTTLSVSDPGLAGGRFGCAQVELATPDPFDPSTAQTDQTIDAFVLKPPAPQLGLLTTIPHELGRGQSRTTEVVVANAGNLTARDVTVTIAAGPGLAVSRTRLTLGALAPGAVARRTVRVALSKNAHPGVPVRVTATGGGSTASERLRIAFPAPALAPPRPDSLAGRDFWRTQLNPEHPWDNHGIAFIDDHWAYQGFPPHGIPECPSAGNGCARYTYNPRTGRLNVGGQSGRFVAGRLTIGSDTYVPLVIPPAGALYNVSLEQQSTFGVCPGTCTTTTKYLSLTSDGLFSFAGLTTGQLAGGTQVGTQGAAGSSGKPNQHGTYEIDERGQIRLMFANGQTQIETIAIQTDKAGRPAPQRSGILIGSTNYYPVH